MLTPKKHSDSWREALKFINRCPICTNNYTPEAARLFAKSDAASIVHIKCGECQSFFVAMILMMGQGLSSVGMVTDLSFEDMKKIHQTAPLSIDEIINGFEQINQKDFIQSLL